MNKLDISGWKEFKISELFSINPTRYHKLINKDLLNEDGTNPVIVNSSYNNGIGGYSTYDCTEEGNTITFSDTTTADSIFYQPNDFVGYSHVQKLTPIIYQDKWTKNCLIFFTTIFRTKAKLMNFDYVNKFTRENALSLLVKLPVKNNEPDWEYMENYIKSLYSIERERISTVAQRVEKQSKKKVDISEWGVFAISELFSHIQQGKRLKKHDQVEGNIPFVMAGRTNTGVANYIANPIVMFPKNSITIDIFGNTFYREYEFSAGDDTGVYWNTTQTYSKNVMLFLVAVIQKAIQESFDFSDKLRSSKSLDIVVSLPITANNSPNWQYMEDYMSNIFSKTKNNYTKLKVV